MDRHSAGPVPTGSHLPEFQPPGARGTLGSSPCEPEGGPRFAVKLLAQDIVFSPARKPERSVPFCTPPRSVSEIQGSAASAKLGWTATRCERELGEGGDGHGLPRARDVQGHRRRRGGDSRCPRSRDLAAHHRRWWERFRTARLKLAAKLAGTRSYPRELFDSPVFPRTASSCYSHALRQGRVAPGAGWAGKGQLPIDDAQCRSSCGVADALCAHALQAQHSSIRRHSSPRTSASHGGH
jgi:hypothetical protein